jgi:hypothetical protein
MDIEENVASSPELQQAEASLDNVLNSIKESKTVVVNEERKTLTLPKTEEKELEQEEEINEEQTNSNQEEKEITEEDFDPKTFVEVDSPQIQKKINYLYKQVKNKDEQAALLKDELRKLAENLELKHQNELYLANELNAIKNKFTQEYETKTLSELRNQYQEAINNYDYETATKINEKIIDFKTEQKLNSIISNQINKEQPIQQKQPKAPSYQSDPQDVKDLEKLSSEKSDNGNLLRPWLNQQHPEFQDVVDLTAALANKYIRKGQRPSLSTLMKEIDSIKGVRINNSIKQPTAPAVLSGQSSVGFPTDNQVKLTNLERTFAAKMGVDEELYAKVKKLSSSGPISIESFLKRK